MARPEPPPSPAPSQSPRSDPPPPGTPSARPDAGLPPLPTRDPELARPDLDLRALAARWAPMTARPAMTAEQMRGADARAQRQGVSGRALMEEAGFAVATAARALLVTTDRLNRGPVLVLGGEGNNGGDGFVAARHLARRGVELVVVLVGGKPQPSTPDARRNWDRLADEPRVERIHAASRQDVRILLNGIERVSLAIDALLGTGVQGPLREPVASAVELLARARADGVPVLAVDTPTALDLSSGRPSEPVVRADVTVTFHRPKQGLLTRDGKALAGRVLVAPIGIPSSADSA